jgi:hypothetical protein
LLGYGAKIAGTSGAQVIELAGATASATSDKAIQASLLAAARALADSLSKLLPSAQAAAQTRAQPAIDAVAKNVCLFFCEIYFVQNFERKSNFF